MTVWEIPGVIPMLTFIKITTLALLLFFAASLRPREFYYYSNLGLSKTRLWATVAAVDLAIFGAAIALTYNLFVR